MSSYISPSYKKTDLLVIKAKKASDCNSSLENSLEVN